MAFVITVILAVYDTQSKSALNRLVCIILVWVLFNFLFFVEFKFSLEPP